MATKSKVDYRLIGLRALAFLNILIGMFILLQSVINFKDVQYYVSEILPDRWTATIIDHGAGYMMNWVYSGKNTESDESFESIYHCKTFKYEASDFINYLMPLKNVLISGMPNSSENIAIQNAVCNKAIYYLNKGYRFFITDGETVVYQDNNLIPRDMKSLKTIGDIKRIIPGKQIMEESAGFNSSSRLQIYITVTDYYYADYDIGLLMIFCAVTGFIFCMVGVIMLERLGGRRVSESKAKFRYFKKGIIEIILAVFLVLSFNIAAVVHYLWAEYRLTDFFESGKAELVAYSSAVLYIILTLWTITKVGGGLNAAEENANTLKKLKADLIANVSHDIKTPLTSIIGYIELLDEDKSLSIEAKEYVDVLKNKSERLKNIVSDLFDLTKSTSGNSDLVIEKLDLIELVNQALAEMEDTITKSGFEIIKKIPDSCVYINADGNKIYRVFQNILDNAFKYSMKDTPVSIILNIYNKKASLEIQNTSSYEMNFTEEDVLERFVRGDSSRTEEGSGLGLSIAETFTKACGGDFKVKISGDQFKVIVEFKRI